VPPAVHCRVGFKTLPEDAKVSYDPEAGDKGPKAVDVTAL
jgi:cold shock CspA family protein